MFRRRVRRRTVGLQALTILRLRFCHLDRSLPFGLGRASAVERPAFRRRRFISRFPFREFSPRNHKCFRCLRLPAPSTSSEYFPFLKYSGAPPASTPGSFVTAKTKPAGLQPPSPLPRGYLVPQIAFVDLPKTHSPTVCTLGSCLDDCGGQSPLVSIIYRDTI